MIDWAPSAKLYVAAVSTNGSGGIAKASICWITLCHDVSPDSQFENIRFPLTLP